MTSLNFFNNSAQYGGGALALMFNASIICKNSTFISNRADNEAGIGGAILLIDPIDIFIISSEFSLNIASQGSSLYSIS